MVNKPWSIRPYFLGGVALGGVARIPMILILPTEFGFVESPKTAAWLHEKSPFSAAATWMFPKIVVVKPPKSSHLYIGLEPLFSPSILGVKVFPLFLVQHPISALRFSSPSLCPPCSWLVLMQLFRHPGPRKTTPGGGENPWKSREFWMFWKSFPFFKGGVHVNTKWKLDITIPLKCLETCTLTFPPSQFWKSSEGFMKQ